MFLWFKKVLWFLRNSLFIYNCYARQEPTVKIIKKKKQEKGGGGKMAMMMNKK